MHAWLAASGQCDAAVLGGALLEGASTSTRSNAEGALALLAAAAALPRDRAVVIAIVTSEYHQSRALRVFEKAAAGMDAWRSRAAQFVAVRVAREGDGARMRDFWREMLATALYWIRGDI
jgi:hypothetical protein